MSKHLITNIVAMLLVIAPTSEAVAKPSVAETIAWIEHKIKIYGKGNYKWDAHEDRVVSFKYEVREVSIDECTVYISQDVKTYWNRTLKREKTLGGSFRIEAFEKMVTDPLKDNNEDGFSKYYYGDWDKVYFRTYDTPKNPATIGTPKIRFVDGIEDGILPRLNEAFLHLKELKRETCGGVKEVF